MTVTATKVLSDFEKLPPQEQALVSREIALRAEARQRAALKRLRGADKGKGLLAKLLADRTRERARG